MGVVDPSIFKACDIRGVYGENLTEDTARRIGIAVGLLSRQRLEVDSPSVVVGRDVRPSSGPLAEALIDGLLGAGCEVTDVGIVPTPAFYFALDLLKADSGVMVTASHNPAEFNGFKLRIGPMPVTPDEVQAVYRHAASADSLKQVSASGRLNRKDVLPEYERHIRALSPFRVPLSVVVDCSNGCYCELAPRVLREAGAAVEELFCTPDGTFPGHPPNPAVAANLAALCERVQEVGADLGIAFDGDGDRVAFVDANGRPIPADVTAVIFIRHLLFGSPGAKVVYDLKCSMIVEEAVREAGCVPLMERSGHAFIKARMIREQAAFGAEISGHFFYDRLSGGDDGLYSALVMMDLVARHGSLADMAGSVPTYHITPDIRIPAEGLDVPGILCTLRTAASGEISELDGLRVSYPDGWALARQSVTEPVITLRFEARTSEDLHGVIRKFLRPVPDLLRRVEDVLAQPHGR
ncbi:MAG: phosphomannomutase/phosphoglucomutase [Armatimonadota bacterium]